MFSEKQRVPSYTDRILYLPGRASDVEVKSYGSDQGPKMSDHKPVGATMVVGIYDIDDKALAEVEGEMARELDGLENERMPDVSIEPEGPIELGRVMVKNGCTVVVSNRKKFEVAWRLIPKLGETEVCKIWLKISQVAGVLRPGTSKRKSSLDKKFNSTKEGLPLNFTFENLIYSLSFFSYKLLGIFLARGILHMKR